MHSLFCRDLKRQWLKELRSALVGFFSITETKFIISQHSLLDIEAQESKIKIIAELHGDGDAMKQQSEGA
ncbi:MAG TPA: hypothetical protein VF224_00715 [Aestuariivirga sp.]